MDKRIIAAVQFEIKLFVFFSTGLISSLIIFLRTYTVNCRNALDRLRVHINIILLFFKKMHQPKNSYGKLSAHELNKKFELMLTKRAKAYSSSGSVV